ncbi:MAG: NAD(P)/FAD-dependent oxidoreductase [Candidatus Bathyarchaeia archaeon]
MNGKNIVILGGGFGGLASANALRKQLPKHHRVIVVEKSRAFSMGLSNLWVMTGERRYPSEGERKLENLATKGIEYVNEEVVSIDPVKKQVRTLASVLDADYLIIALGADLATEEITGFSEAAQNFYDPQGALRLQVALEHFQKGTVAVLVSRMPYKCPGAPYEAAFLIDALFRKRGVRSEIDLKIYTPEPQPMPVAGPKVGEALRRMLEDRNIGYFPEHTILKVDNESKKLVFEVDEARFDLLAGVPPHRAPRTAREAGLLGPTGWIPVDERTLQTRHAGVFAIGDITAIRLLNGMFLPKAGVFAEAEARVLAENISAEILHKESSAFNGEGFCYIEVGDGMAAYGAGNFFASPAPQIRLEQPSARYRKEKEDFESSLLAAWI